MVQRMNIRPNLGMFLPSKRRIMLQGFRFKVIELDLDGIARMERTAARIEVHPYHGLEEARKKRDSLPKGHPDRAALNAKIVGSAVSWPPSMNSGGFIRSMSTPEGATRFLGIMLRKYQPKLQRELITELALAMDENEWVALERIAWGFQDWEAFDPSSGSDNGPGRGMDWAEAVFWLASEMKMSFRDIRRLHVSQFLLLRSGGASRPVCLQDWPPRDPQKECAEG